MPERVSSRNLCLVSSVLRAVAFGWRNHLRSASNGAIQEVTTCVVHQIPLCHQCPNPECARVLPALCWRSRTGYCAYCQRWLGHPPGVSALRDPGMTAAEQGRHRWVSRNVGALLAISPPTVSVPPSRKRLPEALHAIIRQVTQGNISAFARLLHMPQGPIPLK